MRRLRWSDALLAVGALVLIGGLTMVDYRLGMITAGILLVAVGLIMGLAEALR